MKKTSLQKNEVRSISKYIRMSPDHGTAEDKKKLNISNPKSLNSCIELISKLKNEI